VQPFGGDAATHIIYSSIVTVDAELITLVRLLACSGKCAGRAAACERVDPSADRAIAEEGYVQVLVVRHAIAEQKEEFARTGTDDSQRPLTGDGRRKMRRGTAGLRAVVPTIDVLATSPLLRAVQTAEILAAVYNGRNMVTVKELSPDSEFPPFLRWLRTQDAGGTVAIVGHEPHLSGLTSWLLTGRKRSFISLKKGAACLLEFREQPKAGAATLAWALAPSQLRQLGG
jgi:phosphohistidine phosphatase